MASDGEISCTNDPNFAVIYSFLKVFGKSYGLDIPTITKLQELVENTQEVLDPLKELHLRLLRRALKSVQSNRWERGLIKFCHQQGSHQEAWEIERFSYKKASTQVKLKVLKMLLEYQFTCHPKFKTAVNAVSCKDLRLDPVGRDRSGCVYWLQVDHEANLCLYREDQDEETWQLIARNREQLVKVIAQLKSGEDVCPPVETNTNEDSNSAEIPPQLEPKLAAEEENEEEFLSPESESEHEEDQESNKVPSNTTEPEKSEDSVPDHKEEKEKDINPITEEKTDNLIEKVNSPKDDKPKSPKTEETLTSSNEKPSSPGSLNNDRPLSPDNKLLMNSNNDTTDASCEEQPTNSPSDKPHSPKEPNHDSPKDQKEIEETQEAVSEAIEEPLMIVTGEGNGADCESAYILGEEIMEPVMFFYGEGCGYDNDTGNPEVIERENEVENTDEENGNEECLNGENHEISNSSKAKSVKGVKLKSKLPSVTKRTLKKQSTDTSETLKPDTKKPCVRNLDKSDSSNANSKGSDRELKRESSVNDKTTTDSESPNKNHIKKGRNKVKKKPEVTRKLKIKEKKVLNSVVETDNGHDSKTSIIEKRKSSLSSDDQDDEHSENEKDKSSDKELKEDTLPPKKLRLETTPESDTVSHSKETLNATEVVNNSDDKKSSNDIAITNKVDNNPISQRKKIKAKKGKFKRKLIQKNESTLNKFDKEEKANGDKKEDRTTKNKSLKRSLLDATLSDKNKSESQSESEDDEPVTSGKRIKIKPKKIVKSSRKKVEAKLQEKHSSDESEEETLYSIAGKKATKKVLKKKPKTMKQKEKSKSTKSGSESDVAPVRQSRRIAQLKIREEAERRHLEEVALRELKMIHKKKNKDEEEDWQASEHSESDWDRRARKKPAAWRASDSTGPEPDSESDEPLFEHPEPDLEFGKSDHEFSPESDLECDEPAEPLKRARTLQEEKDDGFCKRCGSGEQPEWILLCDKCDAGYHASCLKPVLFLVPEGDWYCPPCNHDMLIASLEGELVKYDELFAIVEAERERRKLEEPEKPLEEIHEQKDEKEKSSEEASSDWSSSSSSEGAVYRLRARRQLPVSYRAQEYDRLISSAIKEEYVEPTTSAGNQGRGKDISTIIEAAEEEKLKAEREALEQGKPVEVKKVKKKQRRKPRKLNSLDVPSEDDDETDEDFKDTGMESSSEEISSSAEKDSSTHSGSSDDLPIRRACRPEKKDRPKLVESSPEVKKKKKGVFDDSSSESGENKEWSKKSKSKSKMKKREKSSSKKSRRRGHGSLTQYDAEGNVIRARVTYGGLSDDENDWSPKHRTRQKKINYTEMPNTESEDEMHKSSGKHMPDSSDEFKIDDSDVTSDSDTDRVKRKREEESDEKKRALDDLITKTAVVPLEKLPDDVTKAKTEELQAHLDAQAAAGSRPLRGKGSRGGRGSRGPRGSRGGRGGLRGSPGASDDALAKLVGVKIKDLKPDGTPRPHDAEREKKRQEREAKQAEKEAKKLERLQKKEEKEKLKEQKAKEREEKRLARLALQESKRMKKEKPEYAMPAPMGYMPRSMGPEGPRMAYPGPHPGEYNQQPRLQVRAELRGVLTGEDRLTHGHRPDGPPGAMREGTLSVAGSPQPFKPITEEPSIITRMPHMINQQYRSPMMYPNPNSGYGPRGPQNMMYGMAHGGPRQYPPQYYAHLRLPYQQPLRAAHPPASPGAPAMHPPPAGMHARPGSGGPPPAGHMPPVSGPPSAVPHGSPGAMQQGPHGPLGAGHQLGLPGRAGSSPHGVPPHGAAGPSHAPPVSVAGMSPHAPPGPMSHGYPRHVNPLGHPGSPAPHGQMGPRGPPHYGPAGQPPPPRPPGPTPPPAASPAATAPGGDAPVQIKTEVKTEVKTEPEYRSPPGSPRDDAPRHPKIKHTENKDRRPRYPLGPYAPYGPYGPYAPVTAPQDMSTLLNLQARLNPQAQSPLQRMHQIHQFLPTSHADGRPSDMASPLRPHLERPPLHMERPQLNMERPPLHMERPPIHMERPQLHHMERPPLHAERPPLHMERPMLHAQRPPLHMDRSPFHMERPPLHAERPPGHMERPPSHNMERPPGHMERPPSHMERPPSHNMERPPGHMERPPSHNMERPPSHIDRSSLHTERPPERPPSHPAQSPTLADRMERPTNMERSPAQLDRPPAHMDRTSAHMNRPPGHMERQPEHMDRPPVQMERPPTHMERTEHMEGPAAHMNRPLGHNMDRPSANMERPPEHMEGPRAHMNLPPGHMERPPTHMDRPPAHMDRPPAHMDRSPAHMDRPPTHIDRPPVQMDRPPAHMDRPPVQMDRPPAHMDRPPVQMDRPPAHMDRPPVQMDRPPVQMDRPPAHMDRPPAHMDRPPMQMDRSPSHEASQPLPPHYLPPHMRQMRPYGMPMPRAPQPDRSSLYGSQYSELHRSALEKQLTAPVSLPQQMPREAVLAKPSSPGPQEPEKQVSREPTPTTAEDEPEPAVDQPQESKEPQLFKLGDDVNRSDEPKLQQIKEEVVSQPREEGSVFGGLVSYFSSQREDDIDA